MAEATARGINNKELHINSLEILEITRQMTKI
jgi:hypothetical protein